MGTNLSGWGYPLSQTLTFSSCLPGVAVDASPSSAKDSDRVLLYVRIRGDIFSLVLPFEDEAAAESSIGLRLYVGGLSDTIEELEICSRGLIGGLSNIIEELEICSWGLIGGLPDVFIGLEIRSWGLIADLSDIIEELDISSWGLIGGLSEIVEGLEICSWGLWWICWVRSNDDVDWSV